MLAPTRFGEREFFSVAAPKLGRGDILAFDLCVGVPITESEFSRWQLIPPWLSHRLYQLGQPGPQ
jgi:hypothetical protein